MWRLPHCLHVATSTHICCSKVSSTLSPVPTPLLSALSVWRAIVVWSYSRSENQNQTRRLEKSRRVPARRAILQLSLSVSSVVESCFDINDGGVKDSIVIQQLSQGPRNNESQHTGLDFDIPTNKLLIPENPETVTLGHVADSKRKINATKSTRALISGDWFATLLRRPLMSLDRIFFFCTVLLLTTRTRPSLNLAVPHFHNEADAPMSVDIIPA